MSKEEKRDLKEKMEGAGLKLDIREVESGDWIKNAKRTGDDHAGVGTCWKEYWQIFTQQDFPTKCPFCGQTLKGDDIDGCHIKIDEKRTACSSRRWIDKKYIIPGHHDCNITYDGECQSKISVIAVEAIEK